MSISFVFYGGYKIGGFSCYYESANSPVVGIICASAPVGDTIAQDDKGAVGGGRPCLYGVDKVPVLGVGPPGERRCADVVAGLHVRRRPAARVTHDAVAGLARLRVQRDGDVGLRVDFKVDWVCVGDLAARDGDGCGPVSEGQGLECGRVNAGYPGFAACWEGN